MRLDQLARRIHGRFVGDSSTEVDRIAPLDKAVNGDLSFLPNYRFEKKLLFCRATAFIVERSSAHCFPAKSLVVDNTLVGLARAADWLPLAACFAEISQGSSGNGGTNIAPSAKVADGAKIGQGVSIGPYSTVGSGCVVGDGVRIGGYSRLAPNVTIDAASSIGNRVSVGANSSLGGDAFSYIKDGSNWLKLPSFGSVEISDDVDLGSNVTIDRGAIRNTIVKRGAKIDNQVHLGHGVIIGEHTAIAARTSIAGESCIGDRCTIAGAVGIGEGITVAADIRITAMSMVTKSLTDEGATYSSGWPVMHSRDWWRHVARFSKRLFGTEQQ